MATSDNAPSDMIEIEIDNFVSPNAANDVPNDDFVPLELDAPIASVPEAPIATVETVEAPSADVTSALSALAESPITNAPRVTLAPTSTGNAFDDSPLTPAEIAERDANRRARAERQAAERARAAATAVAVEGAAPGGNDVVIPDFDGSIVVESITERLHGLSLHYGPCQIPRHTIARDVVIDLLTNAGFQDCIPAIRTGNAQLRKVMNSLNSQLARQAAGEDERLKAWNVTERDCIRLGMEWPANLDSRWCVGLLDATNELGTMGAKVLVVSLVKVASEDGGTEFHVEFSGGSDRLRRAVTERFDALYGTSALNVTDLIQWYVHTLQTKFNAIRQGFKLLIPGTEHNQENMARAERFMQVLQGSNVYGPSPIMGRRLDCDKVTSRQGATWESFCLNVGAGMVEDVRALGQDFAMALKLSQDRARANVPDGASDADIELAVRRAVIGSDRENSAARGLLARLSGLAARARDSVSLIGRTHAKAAIDACEALRAEWVGKCHADSTSSMMAQIELD